MEMGLIVNYSQHNCLFEITIALNLTIYIRISSGFLKILCAELLL